MYSDSKHLFACLAHCVHWFLGGSSAQRRFQEQQVSIAQNVISKVFFIIVTLRCQCDFVSVRSSSSNIVSILNRSVNK